MNKTVYIYTLSCPKTGAVRYVGASNNPTQRLRLHKHDAKKYNSSPTHKWIASLLDEGLMPIIEIVDSADGDNWESKEKHWIQRYKDAGCDLTNQSNGGLHCVFSEQTRLKISKWASDPNTNKLRIPIIQYTLDSEYIRHWISGADIENNGVALSTHVTRVCRGKRKSASGYIWRYADDPIPQTEQPRLFQDEDK